MGQQITPLPYQGTGGAQLGGPANAQLTLLNPGLADRPIWYVGQAATTVVSPDNNTMLVLTSGYNRVFSQIVEPPASPWQPQDSNEYVFIYDISKQTPSLTQVVQIPITYFGIIFDPQSSKTLANGTARYTRFYVAGASYDLIHTISMDPTSMLWKEEGLASTRLVMNHNKQGIGLNIAPNGATAINSQVGVVPCAAGLAISSDGMTLVVANYYNDSITIFTGGYGKWVPLKELDLRPGKSATNPQSGVPGGEYPFWAVVKGTGSTATAYVSSIRDREIDVVSLGATPAATARIKVKGQPNKMTLNGAETFLYVAEDQSDTIDVIDTAANAIVETIPVVAPLLPTSLTATNKYTYSGANPNSVTLSPDETQLYVTNGNLNCVSVIALSPGHTGDQVIGLIPTGWYPNSVSVVPAANGGPAYAYVATQKSPTGANPLWCYGGYGPPNSPNCYPANQYNPQLTKATLQSFPLPGAAELPALTQSVKTNNNFSYVESASDLALMAKVREGIKHVIFILKENRTFDQILGDLYNASNGDPTLTLFGAGITPNQHALAANFVTLDNIMATAEVSYDGWLWSTAAQAPDVVQHQTPVTYAYRALSLDVDGDDRNVNVAIPAVSTGTPQGDVAARTAADPFTSQDPDVLPGTAFSGAPDGPDKDGDKVVNAGYLWDAALLAGLSVRNYGFFIDCTRYSTTEFAIPVYRNPFANNATVAYPSNVALAPFTDPYFRGFDNSLPDYWRFKEWERDFDARYKDNHHAGRSVADMPALTLVRLMHDHTGNYSAAIDGVNTPDLQVADDDYAVGLLVEKISKSPFADSTLIFIIEDDAQDGADHVDSHRTTAYVVGPYVKQGAVVSKLYTTINFIRTMEEVLNIPNLKAALNLPPMLNLNDAAAAPMTEIFNPTPGKWSFKATPSSILYNTSLPLPPPSVSMVVPKPAHNAKYWAQATKGMDFTDADRLDDNLYNRILWKGMMGNKPYPAGPTGADLRQNREDLLARYRQSLKQKAAQAPRQNN
jgi:YVTN family beta-propeller protein